MYHINSKILPRNYTIYGLFEDKITNEYSKCTFTIAYNLPNPPIVKAFFSRRRGEAVETPTKHVSSPNS